MSENNDDSGSHRESDGASGDGRVEEISKKLEQLSTIDSVSEHDDDGDDPSDAVSDEEQDDSQPVTEPVASALSAQNHGTCTVLVFCL